MTADGPPTLTDGVVTLRIDPGDPGLSDLVGGQRGDGVLFAVEAGGVVTGAVRVREMGQSTGELSWALYAGQRGQGYATRAVQLLVTYAFGDLGLGRVQARVEPENRRSVRVAHRAGLRNEGVIRVAPGTGDRLETTAYLLLARLREDPPPTDRSGFRALLNSFLPRKRVIAQALVRDDAGRVLMCQPTYKDDWDLPGGVVEGGESPRVAAGREVLEELALDVPVGRLVLTDWMPPWSGWDDALCLVFDGGSHPVSVLDGVMLQAREIREVGFLTVAQVHDRAADYTARRVQSALAALTADGPNFTESGRPH